MEDLEMKSIMAVIFATLLFAPAAMALDAGHASSTFMEGYDAVEAKDAKKAREKFEQALRETASIKAREDKSDEAFAESERLQVTFFSNCFLAMIDGGEGNSNAAVKRLEAMFDNEKACIAKVFVILPVKGGKEVLKEMAVALGSETRNKDDLSKSIKKAAEMMVRTKSACFECKGRGYVFLGSQYRAREEFQKSADMLTKFIDAKPKEGVEYALYVRAEDYVFLNRNEEAIADLDRVLAKNPRHANSLAVRCAAKLIIYRTGGRKDKDILLSAEKDCNAAATIDPGNGIVKVYRSDMNKYLDELRTGK
jgi:tetratricopeptide (TPR) repeat protein